MSSLPARIKRCTRLTGSFTLRSGKVSDTYFDKYQFEADPQLLRDIAQAMIALVPEGTEVLAGLEMGGISIVTMLSQVGSPGGIYPQATEGVRHLPLCRGSYPGREKVCTR